MNRVTYFRDSKRKCVVCMVFRHAKGERTFSYQMSVHNPKDVYNKKIAVAIATERLESNPINAEISAYLDAFDFNSVTKCKVAMARDIIARAASVPKRAVKMARMFSET